MFSEIGFGELDAFYSIDKELIAAGLQVLNRWIGRSQPQYGNGNSPGFARNNA